MYEDLVKELQDSAEWADSLAILMGRTDGDTHAPIMRKAADAIEELQGRAKVLEKVADKWCETVPKWIPVTERLPKINLDMYSDDLIVCMRRFDGEGYYYEKFAGYRTSSNIWYTYQHDSCSQVGIEQHMKHCRETADVIVAWMPMPEPYKPEEDGE